MNGYRNQNDFLKEEVAELRKEKDDCVKDYGFVPCRNFKVTDVFRVDPPPIINIIQIYGIIEKKRAIEYI